MWENRFYKISFGIILILIILYLLNQVEYIFGPLEALVSFLLVPLLVSFFLYYLLRPMVSFLTKKIKFKSIAIILSFLLLIMLILSIGYFGGNIIQTQIKNLTNQFSNYYEAISRSINNTIHDNERILSFIQRFYLEEKLAAFVEDLLSGIRNNVFGFFSTVTDIGTTVFLIPFILYYFLKDDKVFYQRLLNLIPNSKRKKVNEIFLKIDETLSKYIGGQLIIAVVIGSLTYIGFLIIRLPNALILSLIIMITSFIPFIGAVIGSIPALLIGLTTNFFMVVKILIILIVAQQIEGNIIQPKIQGKRLSIHPLMVIIAVLSFVMLFGFLGALFAVPTYAVIRIIISDIYRNKVLQ